jgi:hypothetical protein
MRRQTIFSKFPFVFKVRFLMQYECMMSCNISDLYISHQKKKGAKYRWRTWENTLIPVVSSTGITYANVVSVPTEENNKYMTCITTYLPSGTHAFNAARTTLHTLRECIHIMRKRPQDIPMFQRPRCTVVNSRTIDTQPLLQDRDCPQSSLILRGRVQDSHHPVGGYLPSYLVVGASLQESKLQKVKAESKSLLAYHPLRLL